ncbi:hypothetical protein [Bacillus amyloliquefaciens]|uniref:hypothetical protein n=1 Tax=Bacillus amyloliquefaciens TaxID=1390 RepID=UPI002808F8F8|nr:hypothetical protein [Bacillus amyloliquefaciens]MDQ8094902.1 hypothetical protein [Bacillus amyloliquefaciens]
MQTITFGTILLGAVFGIMTYYGLKARRAIGWIGLIGLIWFVSKGLSVFFHNVAWVFQ